MRIGIMTIDCGIENQTELFRADLPLRASYSLLQLIFNESVNRNKIFSTGQFFPEKIGPGPKFLAEQNFCDRPHSKSRTSETTPLDHPY